MDGDTPAVVASRGRYDDAIAATGSNTPLPSATVAQPVRAEFAPSKKQLGFAGAALMTVVVLAWGLAASWTLRSEVAVSSHTNDSATVVRNVVPDLALTPAPVNTRGQALLADYAAGAGWRNAGQRVASRRTTWKRATPAGRCSQDHSTACAQGISRYHWHVLKKQTDGERRHHRDPAAGTSCHSCRSRR